jgi:ubiquinone/menaquinone biosynthesis C-methylase UbiE
MHSLTHHHNRESGKETGVETEGHVLNWGWRYDLMLWWSNLLSGGKWQEFERKIIEQARLQPGETVLDVGCGTGRLALAAYVRVGATGRVTGIDPGPKQINRARAKARRAGLPLDFQVGVIERLAFPDRSFDVVLSTFVMHMLPEDLKRQGLMEIARVLRPGGRLLLVDTKRPEGQSERPVHTGPWNSGIQDQPPLLKEAGFVQIEHGEMESGTSKFPEVGFVRGRISEAGRDGASR